MSGGNSTGKLTFDSCLFLCLDDRRLPDQSSFLCKFTKKNIKRLCEECRILEEIQKDIQSGNGTLI